MGSLGELSDDERMKSLPVRPHRKMSWISKPTRSFKSAPVRLRAARYADARYARDTEKWEVCFGSFLAGYLHSQKLKCTEVRVRLCSAPRRRKG